MPQTEQHKTSAICLRISETDRMKLARLAEHEGMNQTEYLTFIIRANYRDFERMLENQEDKI